jgi:hypothetical protein
MTVRIWDVGRVPNFVRLDVRDFDLFVIAHFRRVASVFRDWFRRIGMRPLLRLVGFPPPPTVLLLRRSLSAQLSFVFN